MSSNLPVVQVAVHDGKPTVTSLQVAEAFGKEHKNVIADIRNMLVSKEFNELNFQPVDFLDAKGERRKEKPAFAEARATLMAVAQPGLPLFH